MELEEARARRYSELISALDNADGVFAEDLRNSARSLLLYRIAGSTEKRQELSFLIGTVAKISESRGNPQDLSDAVRELSSILSDNAESQSVGFLFSSMTDMLDSLTVGDLYVLLESLRKEPIHTKSYREESGTEDQDLFASQ